MTLVAGFQGQGDFTSSKNSPKSSKNTMRSPDNTGSEAKRKIPFLPAYAVLPTPSE